MTVECNQPNGPSPVSGGSGSRTTTTTTTADSTNSQSAGIKELFVFDFDETVVKCNSDTFINCLMPGGVVPGSLLETFKANNWTEYMRAAFGYLHRECGVRRGDYERVLRSMPLMDGMQELIQRLATAMNADGGKRYDLIIISDANTFFISTALAHYGLAEAFSGVFTNAATFTPDGCLQIQEYQFQNFCNLSSVNMCKGFILEEFIRSRAVSRDGTRYDRVNYVGDGKNDLCPSLRLAGADRTFSRRGWKLERLLSALTSQPTGSVSGPGVEPNRTDDAVRHFLKMECSNVTLRAEHVPWKTAHEIIAVLDRPIRGLNNVDGQRSVKSLGQLAMVENFYGNCSNRKDFIGLMEDMPSESKTSDDGGKLTPGPAGLLDVPSLVSGQSSSDSSSNLSSSSNGSDDK